jgi:hypothetical protein
MSAIKWQRVRAGEYVDSTGRAELSQATGHGGWRSWTVFVDGKYVTQDPTLKHAKGTAERALAKPPVPPREVGGCPGPFAPMASPSRTEDA